MLSWLFLPKRERISLAANGPVLFWDWPWDLVDLKLYKVGLVMKS